MSENKKVLIAMSGGVDSSVCAHLIKSRGFECIGATMKLFNNSDIDADKEKSCCSLSDIEDARSIAHKIGIPYYVFNFTDSFKTEVMSRFINSYLNAATPNPCIECNKHMKFDKLLLKGQQLGLEYIATGHYAIIENDDLTGRFLLKKAADLSKDQSYVLYNLTQEQLSKTLLPLGTLTKAEVRSIAEQNGFINAKKHDSQDICFVPDGDYGKFIEQNSDTSMLQGNFILTDGTVIGPHKGIYRYTIGQRKGLGIAFKHPLFVVEKRQCDNSVILGNNEDLFSKTLTAHNINLISVEKIEKPMYIKAKVRYNQIEQPALINQLDEDTIQVVFDQPQRAIAKGQAVVFYDGDIVIGGGIID